MTEHDADRPSGRLIPLVTAATGAVVVVAEAIDGPRPYTYVIAVGGMAYAIALLALRRCS